MDKVIIIPRHGLENVDTFIAAEEDGVVQRLTYVQFLDKVCAEHKEIIEYRMVPSNWVLEATDTASTEANFCCTTFLNAPKSLFDRNTLYYLFKMLWNLI